MSDRHSRVQHLAFAALVTLGIGCDPPTSTEWSEDRWLLEEDPCTGVERVVSRDEAESPPHPDSSAHPAGPDTKVGSCPDPDDPRVEYLFEDTSRCAGVSVHCLPGWRNVPRRCGCGCMHDPDAPVEPVTCF